MTLDELDPDLYATGLAVATRSWAVHEDVVRAIKDVRDWGRDQHNVFQTLPLAIAIVDRARGHVRLEDRLTADVVRQAVSLEPTLSVDRARQRELQNLASLADNGPPFLAFVLDERYVASNEPGLDGLEFRLGVSVGDNITAKFGSMLAPPKLTSTHVLGLHAVLTRASTIWLWDDWLTAIPYVAGVDPATAARVAAAWLATITDDEYAVQAGEISTHSEIRRSPTPQLGVATVAPLG